MKKVGMFLLGIGLILALGSLSANASEIESGKAFFKKKRCAFCHTIEGKGGKLGSDLSAIGSKRDHAWFLEFFKNPKKLVPTAKMMPIKGSKKELAALADYLAAQK